MGTEILVVDDSKGVRESLGMALAGMGFDPILVSGPPAAAAYVDRETVRLAIIDIVMPTGSGLSLLADLKARRPSLPCVILSGVISAEKFAEAERLGAYEILSKPVNLEYLENKVRAALGS